MSATSRKVSNTKSQSLGLFHAATGTPGRKKRPETSWTSSSLHHLWSQTSVYQCVAPPTELLKLVESRPSTLTYIHAR